MHSDERRLEALRLALGYHAGRQVGQTGSAEVVETAAKFDEFLSKGETK